MKGIRAALLALTQLCAVAALAGTLVQFDTSVGQMVFELYDVEKPQTVGLFLNWLDQGNYGGTYIHRDTTNYLAQTGRYGVVDLGPPFGIRNIELPIAPNGSVPNEITNGNFIANTYGTISMVPWGNGPGQPNFVTSGFLFNFGANTNLDDPNFGGGFPVFGQLISGWDTFALLKPTNGNPALKITNFSETLSELPVRITAGNPLTYDDFIYVNMAVVPEPRVISLALAGAAALGWRWRHRRAKVQ